jgi:hypothetical protein
MAEQEPPQQEEDPQQQQHHQEQQHQHQAQTSLLSAAASLAISDLPITAAPHQQRRNTSAAANTRLSASKTKRKGAAAGAGAGAASGGWSRSHNMRMLLSSVTFRTEHQGSEHLQQENHNHENEHEHVHQDNNVTSCSSSNGTSSIDVERDGLGMTYTAGRDAAQPQHSRAHPQEKENTIDFSAELAANHRLHHPTTTTTNVLAFEHQEYWSQQQHQATVLQTLRQQLEEEKTLSSYLQEENEELVHDNQALVEDNQEYEEQLATYKQTRDNLEHKAQELLLEVESLQEQLLGEHHHRSGGEHAKDGNGNGTNNISHMYSTRTASNRSLSVQLKVEDLTHHIHQRLKDALYEKFLLEQRMSTLEYELDETHTAARHLSIAKDKLRHKCNQLEKHMKKCSCQEPMALLPEGSGGRGRGRGRISLPDFSAAEAFEKGGGYMRTRRSCGAMHGTSNAVFKAGHKIRRRIGMSFIPPNNTPGALDHEPQCCQSQHTTSNVAVGASASASARASNYESEEEPEPEPCSNVTSFFSGLQHAASGYCSTEEPFFKARLQRLGSKLPTRRTSTTADAVVMKSLLSQLEMDIGGDPDPSQLPASQRPSWNERMDSEKEARGWKDQLVNVLSFNTDESADDFDDLDKYEVPVRHVQGVAEGGRGVAAKVDAGADQKVKETADNSLSHIENEGVESRLECVPVSRWRQHASLQQYNSNPSVMLPLDSNNGNDVHVHAAQQNRDCSRPPLTRRSSNLVRHSSFTPSLSVQQEEQLEQSVLDLARRLGAKTNSINNSIHSEYHAGKKMNEEAEGNAETGDPSLPLHSRVLTTPLQAPVQRKKRTAAEVVVAVAESATAQAEQGDSSMKQVALGMSHSPPTALSSSNTSAEEDSSSSSSSMSLTPSMEEVKKAATALALMAPSEEPVMPPMKLLTASITNAISRKRGTGYARWSNTETAGTGVADDSDLSEREEDEISGDEHEFDRHIDDDDVSSMTSIGGGGDGGHTKKTRQQQMPPQSQSQRGWTFVSRGLGLNTSIPRNIQPPQVKQNRNRRPSLMKKKQSVVGAVKMAVFLGGRCSSRRNTSKKKAKLI